MSRQTDGGKKSEIKACQSAVFGRVGYENPNCGKGYQSERINFDFVIKLLLLNTFKKLCIKPIKAAERSTAQASSKP